MIRIAILSFLATSVGANFLFDMDSYKAPICELHQPCLTKSLSTLFQTTIFPDLNLCSCPDEQACTDDHTLDIQNVRYSFCHPLALLTCRDHEIGLILMKGSVQRRVRCHCPESHDLKQIRHVTEPSRFPEIHFECVPSS